MAAELTKKVLNFWFMGMQEGTFEMKMMSRWFSSALDSEILTNFKQDILNLASEKKLLEEMKREAKSSLAAIILFDQFTRNCFRGTGKQYEYDPLALSIAKHVVESKLVDQLNIAERGFVYLPFEHSEEMENQEMSLKLFTQLAEDAKNGVYEQVAKGFLKYAISHKEIIEKFKRYPHRNALLGRESTKEETEYLENGGETFGATQ